MKKILALSTFVLGIIILIEYNLPWYYWGFFLISVFESLVFLNRNNNSLNIAGYWLYIYIVCSFLVIPAFKFLPSSFTMGLSRVSLSTFDSFAKTSIIVSLVLYACLLISYNQKSEFIGDSNYTLFAPNFSLKGTFLLGFALTGVSLYLGIGKMGVENYRLPFHLSGIIQFIRTDLIPVMALCVYANRKKIGKSTRSTLFLLFVWSVFETMVRLSKSAIMFSFLPIVMYELLCNANDIKGLAKRFAPILAVIIVLYPVIETMRHADVTNAWQEQDDEITGTFLSPNSKNYIVKPFNRTFLSGVLFAIDESTVDKNKIFDFHQASLVASIGGAPKYQTFVIDGYPEGVSHSSGTSPFIDSLLVGGFGLFYISFLIMALFARKIDKLINNKSNYIITAILCVAFYRLFDMPLFTFVLNDMSIRYLAVYAGICMYIRYCWKKQI